MLLIFSQNYAVSSAYAKANNVAQYTCVSEPYHLVKAERGVDTLVLVGEYSTVKSIHRVLDMARRRGISIMTAVEYSNDLQNRRAAKRA